VSGRRATVEVAGRALEVSNREKVLWPSTGFTKGQMLDFYAEVAPVMVPHLAARPVTLRRWPDGVEGQTFFQKNAPKYRPDWMSTVRLGDVDYLRIDEPAGLVWAANLGAIEIHPGLAPAPGLDRPAAVVFDLDPGPPADVVTCGRLAILLRRYLAGAGLEAWVKTSGSKGLQMFVPLDGEATFEQTRPFAFDLARYAEAEHPDLVVTTVEKKQRRTKVLIDWAQNAPSRTTVAVYSLRALAEPSVSTPLTWDELEEAVEAGDAARLRFGPDQVLERIGRHGDLMAAVLAVRQPLVVRS
jgi:bifunctional non-homologous end joining protein LigD